MSGCLLSQLHHPLGVDLASLAKSMALFEYNVHWKYCSRLSRRQKIPELQEGIAHILQHLALLRSWVQLPPGPFLTMMELRH